MSILRALADALFFIPRTIEEASAELSEKLPKVARLFWLGVVVWVAIRVWEKWGA